MKWKRRGVKWSLLAVVLICSQLVVAIPNISSASESPSQMKWRVSLALAHDSPSLSAVSCGSAGACIATDSDGDAYVLKGNSWKKTQPTVSKRKLWAISCHGSNFCVAMLGPAGSSYDDADSVTFIGSTWEQPIRLLSPGANSISCPETNWCEMVDDVGSVWNFNGQRWKLQDDLEGPDNVSSLTSISCSSRSFCVAVDDGGNAFAYEHGSWNLTSNPYSVSSYLLDSVSCPATNWCMATDFNGWSYRFNGSGWTRPQRALPLQRNTKPGFFNSLSCASGRFCVAVGSSGKEVTFNGSTWSAPANVDEAFVNGLGSISCPSTNFCVTTEERGRDAFVGSE